MLYSAATAAQSNHTARCFSSMPLPRVRPDTFWAISWASARWSNHFRSRTKTYSSVALREILVRTYDEPLDYLQAGIAFSAGTGMLTLGNCTAQQLRRWGEYHISLVDAFPNSLLYQHWPACELWPPFAGTRTRVSMFQTVRRFQSLPPRLCSTNNPDVPDRTCTLT